MLNLAREGGPDRAKSFSQGEDAIPKFNIESAAYGSPCLHSRKIASPLAIDSYDRNETQAMEDNAQMAGFSDLQC
jgi:hypothetical protein